MSHHSKPRPEPVDSENVEPIGYDGFGAPIYPHQQGTE